MPGETIYYKSPLGILRIKEESGYILEVHFLQDLKETENDTISPEVYSYSEILNKCIQQLDKYFAGEIISFELPLSQQGSHFQKKVWDALYNIPYGKTISYLELSKRIGNTKAIRAVGSANGKNNIAIIVPCHRVIGSNGNLIGYTGELWRKKWLLNHEAKYANGVQTLF